MQDQKDVILRFFPASLRSPWENSNLQWSEIEEIRIRVNQPVIIRRRNKEYAIRKNGTAV